MKVKFDIYLKEPRCAGASIHFMDEIIMMEKIMEDMFEDEPNLEQTGNFDRASGKFFQQNPKSKV